MPVDVFVVTIRPAALLCATPRGAGAAAFDRPNIRDIIGGLAGATGARAVGALAGAAAAFTLVVRTAVRAGIADLAVTLLFVVAA